MPFHVGQKVICIDPTWGSSGQIQATYCPNLPVKWGIYHIRDVLPIPGNAYAGWWVRLVEVVNPLNRNGRGELVEAVFEAKKYRPVHDRHTDISVFTALLIPARTKEDQNV